MKHGKVNRVTYVFIRHVIHDHSEEYGDSRDKKRGLT